MLKINQDLSGGSCIVVDAAGAVTGDEYELFAEQFEATVEERDYVDLVINLRGSVSYGDLAAFKDDWRFGRKQYRNARRVAIVGGMSVLAGAARLFSPFTRAEEGFFPEGEVDAAMDWACSG